MHAWPGKVVVKRAQEHNGCKSMKNECSSHSSTMIMGKVTIEPEKTTVQHAQALQSQPSKTSFYFFWMNIRTEVQAEHIRKPHGPNPTTSPLHHLPPLHPKQPSVSRQPRQGPRGRHVGVRAVGEPIVQRTCPERSRSRRICTRGPVYGGRSLELVTDRALGES